MTSFVELLRRAERERHAMLEIREKAKRFDGDRPHRYAVVRIDRPGTVPEERMREMLKRLDYAGFKLLSDLAELEASPHLPMMLSTRPQVGAPPASLIFELIDLGIRPGPTCARWLNALGPRDARGGQEDPEEGLVRLGRAASAGNEGMSRITAAGMAPLRVYFDGRLWIANVARDDKLREEIFRSAGWLPYRHVSERASDPGVAARVSNGAWATKDPLLASSFRHFMTDAARENLRGRMDEARKRIALSRAAEAPAGTEIPAPENCSYLPYQKAGIMMALEHGEGVFIADDMGLGKTVQAAGIMNSQLAKQEGEDRLRILVLCQANMKIGWQRELEKWLVNDRHAIGIAEGSRFPETDIVIMNYDIAARHMDRLRANPWHIVVADEADMLSNKDTGRSIAILGDNGRTADMIPIAPGGKFIPMTGTPLPSRTIQIYNLLSAMDPERWGKGSIGRAIFAERYCAPRITRMKVRGRGGRSENRAVLQEDGGIRLKELQLRLRSAGMVRRMKSDPRIMAALPPKFRQIVELRVPLSTEIRRMLKSAETDFEAMGQAIADMEMADNEEAFRHSLSEEGMRAFSEMACLPSGEVVDFNLMARVRSNLAVLKAPIVANFLIEALEASREAERPQKIVCFAHHRKVIDVIRDRVEEVFPGAVVTYRGEDGDRQRQAAVDRLQEDEGVRLFVGSIGAASTGITLTRAERVVFAELDWVPTRLLQAEDRPWRIGQTMNVLVQYLVIANSLEVNLARKIVAKLDMMAQAIGGNPRLSRSLDEIYQAHARGNIAPPEPFVPGPAQPAPVTGQIALPGF